MTMNLQKIDCLRFRTLKKLSSTKERKMFTGLSGQVSQHVFKNIWNKCNTFGGIIMNKIIGFIVKYVNSVSFSVL